MQHAGLQYGQGAANSHQSPPFAHADISQTNGGNTTSSLRQFRKKDGLEKNSSTDLNTSIGENSHIARVPPHNHYPARPNDYYRYHQYSDYNHPFKESAAQVKYSEIAESQPIQHVDHVPSALQKHKEPHKEFVEMCNISHQTHIKQNFPDSLSRQQSYPPDGGTVHHQYLHKEAQVHSGYKPESQYQQYPQVGKYNMPSQYRKYPPPPPPQPPENDFLAKLQRINPSMARSIMSDHHIRETQTNYPTTDQNRMYPQNQRYYPTHIQNNPSYNYHTMPQPYNYPSCNYKHPDYARANQMSVGGAQYPNINPHPDRSISPRRTYPDNLHLPINYGTSPQKISPNYSQYNPPEYAQHYQHRRASLPQDFYHQQPSCRSNPYMSNHQISPEPSDNRASSGLRDFLENWAEEEAPTEIAPIYKENIRIHNDATNEQQIFVINSSDIPQCLENVSLVPTENGQYIIKSGALDSSVVRIKETTENNGERTVNLQIVETTPKSDCMMTAATNNEEKCEDGDDEENNPKTVPYQENQTKDCDVEAKTSQVQDQEEADITPSQCEESEEIAENIEETRQEESVIVCNEVSVIKDMPLIDEEHARKSPPVEDKTTEEITEETPEEREEIADTPRTPTPPPPPPQPEEEKLIEKCEENKQMPKPEIEVPSDSNILTTTKRSQRIFSVDDIINNIGNSSNQSRRSSLQLTKLCDEENEEIPPTAVTAAKETEEEKIEETPEINEDKPEESNEEMEFMSAISVQEDSVILEIGGALVQLNINHFNGTKVLSVLPLSESLVIDVNGNYQDSEEIAEENEEEVTVDTEENSTQIEDDISSSVCQSEVVIGEDNAENEVVLDLNNLIEQEKEEEKKVEDAIEEEEKRKVEDAIEEKEKRKVEDAIEEQKKKVKNAIEEEEKEEKKKVKEEKKKINSSKERTKVKRKLSDDDIVKKPKFNEDEEVKPKKKEEPTPKLDVVKKNKSNDEEMKKTEEVKMKTNEVKKSEEVRMKTNEVKKGEEVKMKTNEIVVEKTEEDKKKIEENERPPNVSTKAAKKLYVNEVPLKKSNKTKSEENVNKVKKSMSKLEETVNKIKSLKEKSAAKEENRKKTDTVKKVVKKVTFNLDTEVREISDDPKKDEYDKKKLSWEEYYNRKRKSPPTCDNKKVMEDTVTSSGDVDDEVIEQVELSIENAIKDSNLKRSPPKMADNNWEEDTESPKMAEEKSEVIENKPSRNNKCIIDVNEFNIKPMESSSTPSPVSSSQFSFNSEDDSLQVYKDVVDSKLNSLNIKIPKITKPKQIETSTTKKFSVLLERFLNKGTLNCNELEKVKKIIEFKRKIEEDLNKKCYEVRGERDYKDLKLHFRKVPEKRKKKRFRNLYTDDTSDDDESDSSRSEKGVGDYSVYQRNSQGVPKLIFKRKSGLPQPFVKLERSQAVELLAKKRKLY